MVKTIKRKRNKNKSKKGGFSTVMYNFLKNPETKEQLAKSAKNSNNHRKSLIRNIG